MRLPPSSGAARGHAAPPPHPQEQATLPLPPDPQPKTIVLPNGAAHPSAQEPGHGEKRPAAVSRSRSLDTIRSFFRRSKAPADGDAAKAVAKPMILDTEKPPQFDEATGRWLFEQTEEEKAQEAMVKAGPPKRTPPVAAGPGAAPPAAGPLKGPPKGPPGRTMGGPGQRPQYVDVFNST